MRMTKTKIHEILNNLSLISPPPDFSIEINGETVYDAAAVLGEFRRYANYDFYQYRESELTPVADFWREWVHFRAVTNENFARTYAAFFSDYNPIENYALNETSLDGEKIDKVKDTTTPHGGTKSETKIFGVDSVSGVDSGTTTNTLLENTNTETEKEYTNSKSGTFDGETKEGYNNVKEHFFKRSGNIGTMTAADMIKAEREMRMKAGILEDYIMRFINMYCAEI